MVNVPLPPATAAQLFYSGSLMLLLSDPSETFVFGRWAGQPCICIVPMPFDDAVVYFTDNPAMLADAYVAPPPGQPAIAKLSVRIGGITLTGVDHMNLPNGQLVDLTVTFYDAQEMPTEAPEGDIEWSSSDEGVATVAADSGSDEATVTSVAVGETTITMTAGSITASLDIAVTGTTAAVSAEIAAGEPYDSPATAQAHRHKAAPPPMPSQPMPGGARR